MKETRRRRVALIALLALLAAVVGILISLMFGTKNYSLSEIIDYLFAGKSEVDQLILRDSRLPRALSALLTGGLLALAGALLQGITDNPLAEPSVMGVTQGAAFGVAAGTALGIASGRTGTLLAAGAGALFAGALVLAIILSQKGRSISKMLLAGTALSAFFLSLSTSISILTNRAQELAFWVSGGFRTADWSSVILLLAVGSITTCIALLLSGRINLLAIGDEAASGLGINPNTLRIQTMIILIPMCAAAVAISGNIAFVGLLVPHMLRRLVGNDQKILFPLSFLCGSALLVYADLVARLINQPYETPVGLFSSLLGVPVFLYLIRKEKV